MNTALATVLIALFGVPEEDIRCVSRRDAR